MEEKTSTERILELRSKEALPEPGVWHPDFRTVKAAAEKTGKPLFAMWINPGCVFCKRFCENALKDRFTQWMASSDAYFWLGSADDEAGRSGPGWEFVLRQSDGHAKHYFPLIAVWQCEAGHPEKVLHDYRASGRTFEAEKPGEEGLANTLKAIAGALKNPPYPLEKPRPRQEQAASGDGCPGGHPHLKAIQQIHEIIRPFLPAPSASTSDASGLAIRMNPALGLQERNRRIQAILDNGGHCPCQKEKTASTVCLCDAFMRKGEPGPCLCGLYAKYIRK